MAKPITAIVYGVGAMNAIATRMMLEKGVVVVGAIARSPEKVGKDLAELAGLEHELGVIVENDAERVLASTSADIALVATSSYMSTVSEQLAQCASHGVNAITLGEECLNPWRSAPVETARLDRIAKSRGVTITGTGFQDAFWVNLVAQMMGAAHRIEAVIGKHTWNPDDYGPEVSRDQRVGDTEEEFLRWQSTADRPPTWGRNILDTLVTGTGLTPARITSTTTPVLAETEMRSRSLGTTVPKGGVIGFTDVDEFTTFEGPTFSFQLTGRLYTAEEAKDPEAMLTGGPGNDDNQWTVKGEPELLLHNPAVPGPVTTCAQFVNRIPDVINAEPGYVTIDRLPPLAYRPFPLAQYLRD